ncbi:MAG TPA: hypothetical protein VFV83_09335 [Chthoniobacteraceae bacterium]|nr:hypothetical protein [Chthoniobacteraceae bacterium]
MTHAQGWRLIGITGQQGDDTQDLQGNFVFPDHTLYEINLTTAAITKLRKLTFVNDSQAIGYSPATGLLYHSAGSESYSSNPFRLGHDQGGPDIPGVGYQDSQYLESINLITGVTTAVFNADPPPNPDPQLPSFGLPAPRPNWVLPLERRDSSQTDESFNVRGPDEYHAARGLAWSTKKGLFYVADEQGIFKLNLGGDCAFLARPPFSSDGSFDNAKAIAFVNVSGAIKLLVGHRKDGYLMEIDPETGDVLGEVPLTYPPGGADPIDLFGGLLGIEQHPVTGVLYGVRKTTANFQRELVTINPVTGATTLVGNLNMHIAGIAFVPTSAPSSYLVTSITRSGNELILTWLGGTPPYQIQTNNSLSPTTWVNVGTTTTGNSAKVPVVGSQAFFRVIAQSAGGGVMTQTVKESAVRKSKVRAQKQRARR